MKTYTKEELKVILNNHEKWLNNDDNGVRANLGNADLRNVNLYGANLRNADLGYADLRNATLYDANLGNADLRNVNLYGANLRNADLCNVNLYGANLGNADLGYADLRNADLCNADLCGANLRNADLGNADLRNVTLNGVFGNMKHVKSLQIEKYCITYTSEILQIGCQRHTIEEWRNFTNKSILEMDGKRALEWWNKWKQIIMQIIEMSPCKPTKEDENA